MLKLKQELKGKDQGFVEINFSVEKLYNIDIHEAIHSAFKAERIREIIYLFIKVSFILAYISLIYVYSQ